MKYLAPTLLLSTLMCLSNAQCFAKLPTPETENQTHCQDNVDLTWHLKESNWTNSKCLDCNCKSCCTGYATPVKFPKDCVSVFDEKTCQYIVHKKDDPSVLCPIYATVGK